MSLGHVSSVCIYLPTNTYIHFLLRKDPSPISLCDSRKPNNHISGPWGVGLSKSVWCTSSSCHADWFKVSHESQPEGTALHKLSLWLLRNRICCPSGTEQGSLQAGASASSWCLQKLVLDLRGAERYKALLIPSDTKLNKTTETSSAIWTNK